MPVTLRGVVRCILLTNSELKSVEGVLVDLLQLLLHLDGEVDQVAAVSVLVALKSKSHLPWKILWVLVNVTQFIRAYFVTLTRMSH